MILEHTFEQFQDSEFVVNAPEGVVFTDTTSVYFCGVLLDSEGYTRTTSTITFHITFNAGEDYQIVPDEEGTPGGETIIIGDPQITVIDDELDVEVSTESVEVIVADQTVNVTVSPQGDNDVTVENSDVNVSVATENVQAIVANQNVNVTIAEGGPQGPPGSGGQADIQIDSEGEQVVSSVDSINFTGPVSVTASGDEVTVAIQESSNLTAGNGIQMYSAPIM